MPLFAGYADPAGRADCYAFGAPVVWEHEGLNPGRSLTAAAELRQWPRSMWRVPAGRHCDGPNWTVTSTACCGCWGPAA